MSRRPSLKTLMLPLLAAGAALFVIGFVAARREAPAPRVSYIGKLDPKNDVSRARGVEAQEKASESRPRRPVLPIAFWDVTELDGEEPRPASSQSYAAMEDSDDASGARWLARATQSSDGDDDLEARDDPAEVAADSMSMISEASRAAAGGEPSDEDELGERA